MAMRANSSYRSAFFLIAVLLGSSVLSGCAPLLIAGGAVGGYAIAKNVDSPPPPQEQGNKGWFGGK
jgi:hypothetical protein